MWILVVWIDKRPRVRNCKLNRLGILRHSSHAVEDIFVSVDKTTWAVITIHLLLSHHFGGESPWVVKRPGHTDVLLRTKLRCAVRVQSTLILQPYSA